jgi:hypothetical protein
MTLYLIAFTFIPFIKRAITINEVLFYLLFILTNIFIIILSFKIGAEYSKRKLTAPYKRFADNLTYNILHLKPFLLRKNDVEFQPLADSYNILLLKWNNAILDLFSFIKKNKKNGVISFTYHQFIRNFLFIKSQLKKEFIVCIVSEKNEIIEYERGLHKSFCSYNGWLCRNYKKIGTDQIRSFIPYENQIVYALKVNNEPIAYMTANINIKEGTQLEKMGYQFPEKYKNNKAMEILNFYNTKPVNGFFFGLLWNYLEREATARGFDAIYASCSKKMLKVYKRIFKFEEVGLVDLGDEMEHILKIKL